MIASEQRIIAFDDDDQQLIIENSSSTSTTTSALMKLSSDDWREICKYSTPCDMFRISQVNREMMEKFLPFNIEKDSSLPFGWTVQFMQKCIARHFRKPLQFKLFTIEEEKLYEKMVNGRISNRKEMFQCLKLYLKYNYLLLNKDREHDWEFIVKFRVRTLIGNYDYDDEIEELKYYHVLIDQLRNNQLRYLRSFDLNDILVVHGYRINKGNEFKIFEISKLDLNEKLPPIIFNYENHYEHGNLVNDSYYNQDTVYGTIIQNAMNKRRFNNCDSPTTLTKRQLFELPQRKVILRLKKLQDFIRSYPPFGMQFMPASVHISTTNKSLNIDYSYPMKTLMSKEVLKSIGKGLLHTLAVVAHIYMNHKVFGFSSFYHNYSQYSYLLSDVLSDSSLFVKVLGCIGMTLFNLFFGFCIAMSFSGLVHYVTSWTNFHHTGTSLYWLWMISNVVLFLMNIDVFKGLYPASLTSIHVFWPSVELFHAFLLAIEFSYFLLFVRKLKFWASRVVSKSVSKISKWFTNLKNRFWN